MRVVGHDAIGLFGGCNLGVVGATGEGLFPVVFVFVELPTFAHGFEAVVLFLLEGVVVFLRLDGKLAGFDFFLGHFHLPVEAEAITVGEEEVLVVVTVPVAFEHGGYFLGGIVVAEAFGVGDIVVVEDTSVLGDLLVIGGAEHMELIAVADI